MNVHIISIHCIFSGPHILATEVEVLEQDEQTLHDSQRECLKITDEPISYDYPDTLRVYINREKFTLVQRITNSGITSDTQMT